MDAELATLSYEAARAELVTVVTTLEGGSLPLEEALELWERAEKLAAHCEARLAAAQVRLAAGTAPPSAADGAAEPPDQD